MKVLQGYLRRLKEVDIDRGSDEEMTANVLSCVRSL